LFGSTVAAPAGAEDDEAVDNEAEVEIKKEDAVVTLEKVDTCTGEEDETKVLEIDPCKVFLFHPQTKEWKEIEKNGETKGGLCYARVLSSEDGGSFRARIVVRRKNNEEVVLNAAVHSGMKPEKQSDSKSTKLFTFNPVSTLSALSPHRGIASRPPIPPSPPQGVLRQFLKPVFHSLQETQKLDLHLIKV
jgi:hypothetical protein